VKRRPDGRTLADQIAGECVMTRWRAMNRVLTAIYDEEFRWRCGMNQTSG